MCHELRDTSLPPLLLPAPVTPQVSFYACVGMLAGVSAQEVHARCRAQTPPQFKPPTGLRAYAQALKLYRFWDGPYTRLRSCRMGRGALVRGIPGTAIMRVGMPFIPRQQAEGYWVVRFDGHTYDPVLCTLDPAYDATRVVPRGYILFDQAYLDTQRASA